MAWGLLLGGRRYGALDYACALTVTAGCALFVLTGSIAAPHLAAAALSSSSSGGGLSSSGVGDGVGSAVDGGTSALLVYGLALLGAFLLLDGLTSTAQDKLFAQHEMHSINQLLWVSAWSAGVRCALLGAAGAGAALRAGWPILSWACCLPRPSMRCPTLAPAALPPQPGAAGGGRAAGRGAGVCGAAPLGPGLHPGPVGGVHGGAGARACVRHALALGAAAGGARRPRQQDGSRTAAGRLQDGCGGCGVLVATGARRRATSLPPLSLYAPAPCSPQPNATPARAALYILHDPAVRRAALCAHDDRAPVPVHRPLLRRVPPPAVARAVVRRNGEGSGGGGGPARRAAHQRGCRGPGRAGAAPAAAPAPALPPAWQAWRSPAARVPHRFAGWAPRW